MLTAEYLNVQKYYKYLYMYFYIHVEGFVDSCMYIFHAIDHC